MPFQPTEDNVFHTLSEGARYALLRRLAPSLRHEAVASLQPIAMAVGVLERRLRDPAPDLAVVQETAARLTAYSRAAVASCLGLIEWLTPAPERTESLQETVRDTLVLLRGNFLFRGFTLRDELEDADAPVHGERLRYVLPACLLWLTDSAGAPAEVLLRARTTDGALRLVLDLQASDGPPGIEDAPAYRPLHIEEVQALAREAGIGLDRQGDTLSLTLVRAS
ncbi:MAG: hypothetical protein RIS88_13 [Pseudomonadota bacterium]